MIAVLILIDLWGWLSAGDLGTKNRSGNSAYRQEEFSRRQRKSLEDFEVWVVSPEDLVLSKMEWSLESRSQVQENDILSLLQALPDLDRVYIEGWAERLGMADTWRKYTQN